MNESCKNCPYVENLEGRVDKLEDSMEGVEKDVSDIKVSQGKTEEKSTTIFNTLKKIETSMKDIQESKNNFIRGIASGVIITIIATFVLQIFKTFHW